MVSARSRTALTT